MRHIFFLLGLHSAFACSNDLHCSLNGKCKSGTCECYPAWSGYDCGRINLLPTPRNAGYNRLRDSPKTSSWGGTPVQDPSDPSIWHLFAAEFVASCGLDDWSPNSRVVRAVSRTGALGPYVYAAEILPTFHHNPQVVRAADGSYLLYVIGRTCAHTVDCKTGPVPAPAPHPAAAACPLPKGEDPAPGNMESGISLFRLNSTALNATAAGWASVGTVLGSNGPDPKSGRWTAWDADTNNPAPLTTTYCATSAANGSTSTLLMYRGCGYECGGGEKIGMASAPAFDGTYTRDDAPLCDGRDCLNEDPFFYQDQNGNYHALFHFLGPNGGFSCREVLPGKWRGCDVGSHAFSPDGRSNWTFSKTVAYNATVRWADGGSTTMSRLGT